MPHRTHRCEITHQTISGFSPQKFAGENKQGDAFFAISLAPWFQLYGYYLGDVKFEMQSQQKLVIEKKAENALHKIRKCATWLSISLCKYPFLPKMIVTNFTGEHLYPLIWDI